LIVDPGLRLANWTAPRRLQSLNAAVQADAAVSAAPDGSWNRSTVIMAAGDATTSTNTVPWSVSSTRSLAPFTFCGSAAIASGASASASVVVVISASAATGAS
jgi:hypothetical protein